MLHLLYNFLLCDEMNGYTVVRRRRNYKEDERGWKMVYDLMRIFLDPLNLVVGVIVVSLTAAALKWAYREKSERIEWE